MSKLFMDIITAFREYAENVGKEKELFSEIIKAVIQGEGACKSVNDEIFVITTENLNQTADNLYKIFYKSLNDIDKGEQKENVVFNCRSCKCDGIPLSEEDVYKYICTIISGVAGTIEKSFPSKILHTFDTDSPIIDSNVLSGFGLPKEPKKIDEAVEIYRTVRKKYYSGNEIKINNIKYSTNNGLIGLSQIEAWPNGFTKLCEKEIKNITKGKYCENKKKIKNILKDICKVVKFKDTTNKVEQLKLELVIEELFAKTKSQELLQRIKDELGINIIALIKDISEVKKIDFYLWARFSESKKSSDKSAIQVKK